MFDKVAATIASHFPKLITSIGEVRDEDQGVSRPALRVRRRNGNQDVEEDVFIYLEGNRWWWHSCGVGDTFPEHPNSAPPGPTQLMPVLEGLNDESVR